MKCGNCNGSGQVYYDGMSYEEYRTCKVCHGTGTPPEKPMSEQITENSSIYDSGFSDGYDQGQDDLRNSISKEVCYFEHISGHLATLSCKEFKDSECRYAHKEFKTCPYCSKRIEIKED